LTANVMQCLAWFKALPDGGERMIGALPFFHVFAMTAVMNFALAKGCGIVLHPRVDVKAVLDDISRKKPSLLPGVPTLFAAIANFRSLEDYDLSSLKMCISGGAPLPGEVKEKFESLTGATLFEGYGLSESSPVAALNPPFGKKKKGSIGVP